MGRNDLIMVIYLPPPPPQSLVPTLGTFQVSNFVGADEQPNLKPTALKGDGGRAERATDGRVAYMYLVNALTGRGRPLRAR